MTRPEFLENFHAFRHSIAAVLRSADAPDVLIEAIDDVDNEDDFARLLHGVYDCLYDDYSDGCDYLDNSAIFHDMLIDLIDYMNNAWNFGPGEAPVGVSAWRSNVEAWSYKLDEELK